MLLFMSVPPLRAQFGTATLSGTVTDPTGASVPSAQVTLEGALERTERQTTTDTAGMYVIPAITPGTYRLVVKASGFVEQTLTNIVLTSGQGSTLNVALALASTATQVSVHAASPLLETTTAAVGTEVTSQQFAELPMLGRNFTTLIDMLPGVANVLSSDATYAPSGVNGAAVIPSVYGQRQRDNYISLDGVPDLEPDYGRVGMFPPPEAIAEMKVETSMDTGAYGWGPGATVNLVTKSGTNAYHGDAWEFIRNGDLNARSYFVPNIGAFQWNQFGFAGGGPLAIPHVLSKDRAWYVFGYYEGIRHHQAANFTALVPTAAELGGDFSADVPIYNPYTTVLDSSGNIVSRQQFMGNQILQGQINTTALGLAKELFPLPNLPAGAIPGANFINSTPLLDRSDQWDVRVDHQFGTKDSFYARYTDWDNPILVSGLPALPEHEPNRYTNIAASDTYSFSPNFLITGRFGLHREVNNMITGGPDVVGQFSLQDIAPPFNVRGINSKDQLRPLNIAGYPSLGQGIYIDGPQYILSWTGDARWIAGRHTIGFGGGFIRTSMFLACTFGFECFGAAQTALGPNTGDPLASFLLGLPQDAQRIGGNVTGDFYFHNYSYYVQDSLHVSKKLTLNLGLRWDYISPPTQYPGLGSFDWNTGQYYYDRTNPITGQPANIRRGFVQPDYRGFQPRLGIGYQLNSNTVVRSSFGIFNGMYGSNLQGLTGVIANWPFAFPQTIAGLNTGLPTAFMQNPFPGPLLGSTTPNGCYQCMNIDKNSSRNPYAEEWSFSLQQQLTPSLLLEAAYIGSHGVKLDGQIVDNTATTPGTNPYPDRQRWPQFPPYVMDGYREFQSWYDGLSMKLQKRESKNLSFLISYAYAKALDQMDSLATAGIYGQAYANPTRFNAGQFRGPANFGITHLFSASYDYHVPLKTGNRMADAVVANWGLSGIFSADSGVPYYVFLSTDNENIGTVGRATEFPNMVCNPNTGFTRSLDEWFNTNCYQLPTYGTAGQAGKHALYSDPLFNWDSSLAKDWPFGEGRRVEFRAEFFNFLNGHTFDAPGSNLGTSNFGEISNTTRQPGRNVQFAIKLHF
jgi:hypothetical protein